LQYHPHYFELGSNAKKGFPAGIQVDKTASTFNVTLTSLERFVGVGDVV